MPILPDGTVVPSYMGVSNTTSSGGDSAEMFANWSVRPGEVVAVYYPTDTGNISKNQIEYTVNVQYRDSNGANTVIPYRCVLADELGSIADYMHHSLRVASYKKAGGETTDGARVLVAFPNGDGNQGIIISGVQHPKSHQEPTRQRGSPGQSGGRFYNLVFNGVELDIDDSGALRVQVNGATNNDGSPDNVDSNLKGTSLTFSKDGVITVANGDTELIEIKTSDHSILVKSQSKVVVDSKNVYVGKDSATENLVLGQKLVSALSAFVDIWTNDAEKLAEQGNLGFPVPLNPKILAALKAWKAKWVTGSTPPILSADHFTER